MLYLGNYYRLSGVNTSLNIPRTQYLSEYNQDEAEYKIVLKNNISKNESVFDTENGLVQDSSNPYFYTFTGINTRLLTEGEYTLTLFQDDNEIFNGLLTYRNSEPALKVVYEKTTQYTVYE